MTVIKEWNGSAWVPIVVGKQGPVGPGLDTGGATNDLVVKQSATDYDTAWSDEITVDQINLDTTAAETLTVAGQIAWDIDVETALIQLNANTALHVGQETFFHVKNQTGVTITKGTAVRASGTVGSSGRILIAPFLADGTYPSQVFIGVVTEDIANGDDGFVTQFGLLKGVNTAAFADFDILYASSTVAGGYVANTAPVAPNNHVIVALVIDADANGSMFVRPTLGSSLADDEKVDLAGIVTGETLIYNGTSGIFEPGPAGLPTDDADNILAVQVFS
jgi:hypothetical protein